MYKSFWTFIAVTCLYHSFRQGAFFLWRSTSSFLISPQKHVWYLEAPWCGASNEYPSFCGEIRKTCGYPLLSGAKCMFIPSFYERLVSQNYYLHCSENLINKKLYMIVTEPLCLDNIVHVCPHQCGYQIAE